MSGFSDPDLGMELGFRLGDSRQDDDFVVDSDECSLNYEDDDDRDYDEDVEDFMSSVPLFWDSLQLEGRPDLGDWRDDVDAVVDADVDVDVEWEEINSCIDEGELLCMIFDVDDECGLGYDIADRVGDADGDGEVVTDLGVVGNLEWEVVYELGFSSVLDDEIAGSTVFFHDDGDFYAAEYEPMLGPSDNGSLGMQPASKSAVDALERTTVLRTTDDDDRDCVICRDGLSIGEEATKMPCDHVYHSDCILTWLQIRNTCPVCRFTLPKEDANR